MFSEPWGKSLPAGKTVPITNYKVRHKCSGAILLLLKQITIIQRCSIFFSSKFSRKKESAARQDLKFKLWYLFVLKNLKSLFSVQMFITKMVTLWNDVKSSFLTRDIVTTKFRGKTGNRIVQTGNGIILTFYIVRHFQVDDFRLLNFVSSSFLARDIVIIRFLGKTGNRIV